MRVLRVGDPHITVRNLQEADRLLNFILDTAINNFADHIEFLGDLMHTHAVIRVEVLDFWQKKLKEISAQIPVIILVGNHDQPGSKEKEQQMNALNIFKGPNITIVNQPMLMGGIAYMPYMSDHQTFLKDVKELYDKGATKVLVAHQNFTIPLYHDMMDPNLIPQDMIITGHIHEHRVIGKVFQPGTPKWDTMTDANEDKGIWLFNHSADGTVESKQFVSTRGVVTPITKIVLTEGDGEVELPEDSKNYLQLVGSTAWIVQMKKKYKGMAQISAKPSDRKNVNINKDKVFSVLEFLDTSFKPIDGVNKEDIKNYLKEVINV